MLLLPSCEGWSKVHAAFLSKCIETSNIIDHKGRLMKSGLQITFLIEVRQYWSGAIYPESIAFSTLGIITAPYCQCYPIAYDQCRSWIGTFYLLFTIAVVLINTTTETAGGDCTAHCKHFTAMSEDGTRRVRGDMQININVHFLHFRRLIG